MRNKNLILTVEMCHVMETHVRLSVKHKLVGYISIALRAYVALFRGAMIAASEERDEIKAYEALVNTVGVGMVHHPLTRKKSCQRKWWPCP